MKIVKIDKTLFKDELSMKTFFEEISKTLKAADGDLVPVHFDGKVIAYLGPPPNNRPERLYD